MLVKNTNKIKNSVRQRISNMNCMNYDHNQFLGLFKFQSGYRKHYLNSSMGYHHVVLN